MHKSLITIFFLFSLSLLAQNEKRLGLVIGNSTYLEGELKNPVNDALLIAKALDSLNFDVILDTNITSRREFINVIREFGNKRKLYDVAFVYYAGHGIQIGSENFLLPTEETFNSEDEVIDFGVSVQNILRYLNQVSDRVNILVLDACRNNPYERKWEVSRSLSKGNGLAKIPPPTGSLIAFSTEAGSTAEDGDGVNSAYCKSLYENILKEDISLDQVFRNVRSDVLQTTGNKQRPIEASQLTGDTYYLNPKSSQELREEIIKNMLDGNLVNAMNKVDAYLMFHENDVSFLTQKGHIYKLLGEDSLSFFSYSEALKLDPTYLEAIESAIIYGTTDEDLGIINSIYSSEVDSIPSYYSKLYPDNYHISLSVIRNTIFNGNAEACRDALVNLNLLMNKLKKDELSLDQIKFGSWSNGRTSSPLRTIQNNMMYVYECLEDYQQVINWATICQELEPSDPWPYIMLARSYDKVFWNDTSGSLDTSYYAEKSVQNYLLAIEKIEDEILYTGLIDEFLQDLKYWVIYNKVSPDLVRKSFTLGKKRLLSIDNDVPDAKWRKSQIRFSLACIEAARGNDFKALSYCSQGLADIEGTEDGELYSINFYELYTLIYGDLGETEMHCEAVQTLAQYLDNPYYEYFNFLYSKEEILELSRSKTCN